MQSSPSWSDPEITKYQYDSIIKAQDASIALGCVGYHQLPNGKYIPCKSISVLKRAAGIPKIEKAVFKSSNFETIDYSVYNWLSKIINVHATSKGGFEKVPITWLTAERAYQVKNDKEKHQLDTGALVFPIISIKRESAEKAKMNERPIPGNLFQSQHAGRSFKANPYYLSKRINQDKTKNFANATSLRLNGQLNFPVPPSQRVVYDRYWVPLPIYYNLNYSINLRSDYQQQMNEMLQPFAVYTNNINSFLIYSEYHKYEAFIEDSLNISDNLEALGEEEKRYEATIKLKVLGFISDKGINDDQQKVTVRENLVQVRFPRERVMLGDMYIYSNENEDGFYKP
jgi:hypothetical protein